MSRPTRLRVSLVAHLTAKANSDGCGVCDQCKGEFPFELCEIDHVDGRLWSAKATAPHTRAKRYWSEFLAGVRLRVLCRECNARDGAKRGWAKRRERARRRKARR